ncbi:MAG: inositol monophosphatase [Dehalococcoidia bacterium]
MTGAGASPETSRQSIHALEAFAVDLARVAGNAVERSLDAEIDVAYKDLTGPMAPTDAVTNVDREIEEVLVERIREAFPDHAILGEEGTQHFPAGFEYAWMIDPIDGTQNFVNGLPIYSASIGVLHHGRPVAGAIWGASTHRLGPGVYHARAGGPLMLNSDPVEGARSARGRLRGLGAMPHDEDQHLRPGAAQPQTEYRLPWDRRHVGSGALEAAFVAAGVFESAFNTGPRVWDIAAGALLVQAGGRHIWTVEDGEWIPLTSFGATAEELAMWRRPVLMATDAAYARINA